MPDRVFRVKGAGGAVNILFVDTTPSLSNYAEQPWMNNLQGS